MNWRRCRWHTGQTRARTDSQRVARSLVVTRLAGSLNFLSFFRFHRGGISISVLSARLRGGELRREKSPSDGRNSAADPTCAVSSAKGADLFVDADQILTEFLKPMKPGNFTLGFTQGSGMGK